MKKILEKTIKNKLIFIFDFDGVIADTMKLKGKVFSGIFTEENVYREKMDKLVGKKGSHLSGGQRQIVWLLRSIFKKNPVVILDEPTSSLDSKSTSQVIKFIEYLKKTKSVIIISHNNSLVKLADRLIVLDKGVIVKDQKK